MKTRWSVVILVGCGLALFALLGNQSVSDEEAVRAVNQAWFKAYTAGDIDGLVALYADDAVLGNPGAPPSRGQAAIREAYTKELAEARTSGVSLNPNASTDVGISDDLAWEWGGFTATDKSGASIDSGKYLTVFAKRDGKWVIVRDMWNSNAPMQAGK